MDLNTLLPLAGLAFIGYLLIQGEGAPNGSDTGSNGMGRYMSNQGPAFNSSSIVKQTRALSGYQPNWIKESVPVASLNDPAEAERMGDAVRNFLLKSQQWEYLRFQKNGYRVILPNNRKLIFVKNN